MPKVAVYEDSNLLPGEYNIRIAGKITHMFTEPQASLMENRADQNLKTRILPPNARHAVTTLLGCQIIPPFVHSITFILYHDFGLLSVWELS